MRTLYFIVVFLLTFIGGLLVGRLRKTQPSNEIHTDTVIVRDTLRVVQPVPVKEEVVRYVKVQIRDTISTSKESTHHTADTGKTVVRLPITQKVYKDSAYTAYVSGYRPQLDSIEVYRPTYTITKVCRPKPQRWSFGLQAGLGLTPKGIQPYVGIGVGIRLH